MAKDVFTFVAELKKEELAEMKSDAIADEMAKITGFKDEFMEEYCQRMGKYHAALDKAIKQEHKERNKDPKYAALAQGVGI
jgi:hypothetical protein